MEKKLVFGLFFFLLSLLINQTTQTCIDKIEDHLGKCKCNSGKISCMQQEKAPEKLGLTEIFLKLADFIKDKDIVFNELLIVESRENYMQEKLMFQAIKFQNVEIHEKNLTQINESVFLIMSDTLKKLFIKSEALQSFSETIKPLKFLEQLYLILGLRSFRELKENALTELNELDAVSIDGVVSTVRTNAVNNLPKLERIRITNQLETVETGAFDLKAASIPTVIDLSDNRLTNTSFAEKFIVQSKQPVTLILSRNRLTTLPANVFMTFLDAHRGNKLVLTGIPFECGQCQSEWIVNRFDKSRVEGLTCANNKQTSPWKYNWQCKASSSALSLSNSHILLTILFIASAFVLL